MALLKLYNEVALIAELQGQTVKLIRTCPVVEPIKKLVSCHDILELTLEIANKFPTTLPTLPECDEGALLDLRRLTQELGVYHHLHLPQRDLLIYAGRVAWLLELYQVPRRQG